MPITTGYNPKELNMTGDFGCEDHAEAHPFHEHPDGKHNNSKHLHDHERGAGHPAHHTKGKMPSQLNPDHGPHHMKR